MNAQLFEFYLIAAVFGLPLVLCIATGIYCWWKGRK